MSSEPDSPDGNKAHREFLQICNTFPSRLTDPVLHQNGIWKDKHDTPKNINDRDVIENEVSQREHARVEREYNGQELVPAPFDTKKMF